MIARLAALPLLLTLAACSSGGSPQYLAQAEPQTTASTPATVPVSSGDPSLMLVDLPQPGGAVRAFRESAYVNGLRQTATLEGAVAGLGANQVEIAVETRPSAAAGAIGLDRPSEAGVRREILSRYPGLDMRIVTQPRQNGLGIFGLAIGRARNGARCVFAWQWVDDIRKGQDRSIFARFSSETPTPASIRVHMCRSDATVDDLAATVEGMSLASPATLARALDPARRPSLAAVQGRSVRGGTNVADGSLESALGAVAAPERVAAAPSRKAARSRHARRRAPVVDQSVVAREAPAPAQPIEAAPGAGPRYLAPLPGQSTMAPGAPGVGAAAMSVRQLDQSLPAAAYRGPTSRNY